MAMPTFYAGRKLTGAQLELMARQIDSLTTPGWTTYGSDTTTLTATTTAPTKGNSTYAAEYRRPAGSDEVEVRIRIDIGSTFSAGSGNYLFLLPTAATAAGLNRDIGTALVFDTGTAYRHCVAVLQDTTHFAIAVAGASTLVSNAGSGTAWATGDYIICDVAYQPA